MVTTNSRRGLYLASAIGALCFWLAAPVLAQTKAGQFQFVTGEIKLISAAGAERVPVKGDAFQQGDTIVTGANGVAQIRMSDGGFMAVRPDTHMRLDQYLFNGREDGSERSLVSLIKGGFRAITGLIGNHNKDNYRINTATATIGIRGTDHEPVVIPVGAPGAAAPGTYEQVYRGVVIMQTEKGNLLVNPNQVGFVSGKNATPVLLPKIPDFYNKKPRGPDPVKDSDTPAGGGTSTSSDGTTTATPKASAARTLTDSPLKKDAGDNSVQILRTPLDTTSPVKDLTVDPSSTLKAGTLKTDTIKSLSTDTLKSDTTPSVSTDALRSPATITDTTIRAPSAVIDATTTLKAAPITTTPITTTPITTTPITITPATTAPITIAPATIAPINKPVTTITAPAAAPAITAPRTVVTPPLNTITPVTRP